jgi:hypothetical protein
MRLKLCSGQEVALVGAGNSAGQPAVYLASHVTKVWLLVRGPELAASMSRYLVVASIPGNLLAHWSLWTSVVFALCNAGQVLLMAGLIERYFGSAFSLDSLRQVLGLVAAAIAGTAAAAIGGTLGIVLVEGSTAHPVSAGRMPLTDRSARSGLCCRSRCEVVSMTIWASRKL